ncbi:MAG: AAA-like domain-containing protein [Cyanobacteria bacterium P01_E01_bin.42]
MAKATISKFFTGKPISHLNFVEICETLGLDWQEISEVPTTTNNNPEIYIERPPVEEKCYQEILKPNSLIRIKAPKQMGKTLLARKLLDRVTEQGYRTVYLSFKAIDRSDFRDLTQFLRQFCNTVSLELDLNNQLEEYWQNEIGSKSNCTNYFEKYLLMASNSPLVLCLDDVDLLFPYEEIAEEFFTLLRFWYERAKNRPIWTKLRFIIVYSTDIYIPLDINHSPFNVGLPIELPTFTSDQVQNFAKQHRFDWGCDSINQLMKMFNGHPSLIKQALYHLKITPDITLEKLLKEAPTDSGIYSSDLRNLLLELQNYSELRQAFSKVIDSDKPIHLDTLTSHKLYSMGLVKHQQDKVEVSCNLYRLYFQSRLLD